MNAIDLFAGSGGMTTGAIQAGVDVLWAANHWPLAVTAHAANHPGVAHVCQDLHLADVSAVPAHDICLASPCCQGHSRSRGKDQPHHDASRATAWVVPQFCEYHRPKLLVVENVPEFMDWVLYPSWADAMKRLGYSLSAIKLDAADCGVPQHRVRLFIVGRWMGKAIEIEQPAMPHVSAAEVIDFDAGSWSDIDKEGRSPKTLARIASGREEFGERFVMPYYSSGSGLTGRSLGRPLGTVTTKDRWAVVDGDRMRMLTVEEYRKAMGFPAGYRLADTRHESIHLLGNSVCPPVAAHVVGQAMQSL